MDAIPYVDSLVKEYLLFRGFTGSLRAFNRDIASDRGRGFQADQLTELLFRKLLPLDQAAELMEVLEFLSSRVYSRLPGSYEGVIRKLEVGQGSKRSIGSKCSALRPQSLTVIGVYSASLHNQSCSSRKADCSTSFLFKIWRTATTKYRVYGLAAMVCPSLPAGPFTRPPLSSMLLLDTKHVSALSIVCIADILLMITGVFLQGLATASRTVVSQLSC